MKWYMNMKIASKLITGFIIVALIAAAVGVIGIVKLKEIDGDYSLMYSQNTVPIAILGDISPEFQRIRVNLRNMITDKDINNRQSYLDKINQYQSDIDSLLPEYGKQVSTGEEKTTYDALLSQLDKLKPLQNRVIELINNGQEDAALNELLNTADPVARDVDTSLGTLIDINKKQASERSVENSANANSAVIMMIGVAVIGVILSVLLGLFISRIINNPIKKLVSAAEKLSLGDINVNVEATTKDEIGDLMKAFASMVENIREQAFAVSKVADGDLTTDIKVKSENDLLGKKLSDMISTNNEILGNINSASDQVAAGARQVSASSQALSQGSTEQASSVEEITSSITELAAQTKQNAINAGQANELAIVAKDNAVLGNSQMQDMVKAMAEINDSSNNISKIIKVIDEIAFQTNILALNAAVEAARAGQHGKGFAVVAEEVRNLAARSANAAKETTSMIEGSIKKVEAGTKIANDTAEALYKIVSDVTKAVELVGEIAVASNQQATGISQISSAVEQVSQVVQTNSATAEESASASEELSSQAELLRESVRKFQLKKVRLDSNGKNGIDPEMMQAIEEMLEKKKDARNDNHNSGAHEAAAAKIKIELDDKEFGKY